MTRRLDKKQLLMNAFAPSAKVSLVLSANLIVSLAAYSFVIRDAESHVDYFIAVSIICLMLCNFFLAYELVFTARINKMKDKEIKRLSCIDSSEEQNLRLMKNIINHHIQEPLRQVAWICNRYKKNASSESSNTCIDIIGSINSLVMMANGVVRSTSSYLDIKSALSSSRLEVDGQVDLRNLLGDIDSSVQKIDFIESTICWNCDRPLHTQVSGRFVMILFDALIGYCVLQSKKRSRNVNDTDLDDRFKINVTTRFSGSSAIIEVLSNISASHMGYDKETTFADIASDADLSLNMINGEDPHVQRYSLSSLAFVNQEMAYNIRFGKLSRKDGLLALYMEIPTK